MLDLTTSSNTEAAYIFSRLLGKLGWVEGRDFTFELRSTGGNLELQRQYAEEFVRLNVSVIMTLHYGATMAAFNATKRIPIVMNVAEDPVKTGFVASLAKPGGNITGVWFHDDDVTSKRLAMLRELLPNATRVAVPARDNNSSDALRRLGFEVIVIDLASREAIETAMDKAHRRGAEAVIIPPWWIPAENWTLIVRLANQYKVPVVSFEPSFAEEGALMSFSVDPEENYLTRALQVDKILRGARPADLPVQQPSKFVLSINLQVARALGITVPRSLLLRADNVIQ
jgi:putative ABC transport system substrate-binding protein